MRLQTVLLLGLLFFLSSSVFAQEMSKEEKKKWVSLAKNYKKDPALLKNLVEERDGLRRQIREAQTQAVNAQNSAEQAQKRASQLEQNTSRLNKELIATQETIRQLQMENERLKAQATTNPIPPTGTNPATGVVFRVQVGAFSKGRIPQKFQSMPDMTLEDTGTMQRVLIGNYRNIEEARKRASQLKVEGADGAFVVAYKNGERISVEEALRN